MLKRIISGGQSGADLAGVEFARGVGLATGVFAFYGFHPTRKEDLALYQSFDPVLLKVTDVGDYVKSLRERTLYCVRKSDATVIFVARPMEQTRGSRLTLKVATWYQKPCLVLDVSDVEAGRKLKKFLESNQPATLNVAGERTLEREWVQEILRAAIQVQMEV